MYSIYYSYIYTYVYIYMLYIYMYMYICRYDTHISYVYTLFSTPFSHVRSMHERVEFVVLQKMERNRKLQMHLIGNSQVPIC